jgi:hypothetical protein
MPDANLKLFYNHCSGRCNLQLAMTLPFLNNEDEDSHPSRRHSETRNLFLKFSHQLGRLVSFASFRCASLPPR